MTASAKQYSQQTKCSWSSLCCPGCQKVFSKEHAPLNLVCGHALCYLCAQQPATSCPLDQTEISADTVDYPLNLPLLSLLGIQLDVSLERRSLKAKFHPNSKEYSTFSAIESLLTSMAKSFMSVEESERGTEVSSETVSRALQRKILALLTTQLVVNEGRVMAFKTLGAIAERIMTEIILATQNSSYISSNLWTAVRSRGCQFLGTAMQEDALRLILKALSKGEKVARKTLVMHVVDSLSKDYPNVSKTCIGHVVQLLYRASCFNVIKRDQESSLMQLKEEFRNYESLRLEHDSQIIQIACEANLKISPEQWSSLLYGDLNHRSQMQTVLDKLWTANPSQMFCNAINELKNCGLGKTAEFDKFEELVDLLSTLNIKSGETENMDAESLLKSLSNSKKIINIYVAFSNGRKVKNINNINSSKKVDMRSNSFFGRRLYKTRLCWDVAQGKACLVGDRCTYAHRLDEIRGVPRTKNHAMGVFNGQSQELPPVIRTMHPPPDYHGMCAASGVPGIQAPIPLTPVILQNTAPPINAPLMNINSGQSVPIQVHQPPLPIDPSAIIMVPPPQPLQLVLNNPTANQLPPAPLYPFSNTDTNMFPYMSPPSQLIQRIWKQPNTDTLFPEANSENRFFNSNFFFAPDYNSSSTNCITSSAFKQCDEGWADSTEEEQLLLRRNEIISRLGQIIRPCSQIDENNLEDDLESHVSFTVANSVLSDSTFVCFEEGQEQISPIELPPLPMGHSAIGQFQMANSNTAISQMSLSMLNTMTYSMARESAKPSLCSTIRTACPSAYPHSQDSTTVQSDCSIMNIKDAIDQPLVISSLQQQNLSPQATYDMVDPCNLMEQLPTTIKPLQMIPCGDPQDFVACSLDRIMEMKERISDVEKNNGISSAVEKEQMKVELRIASRQISSLDEHTKESCLLKELKAVDEKIENLNINA